jgi:hypothetical protein
MADEKDENFEQILKEIDQEESGETPKPKSEDVEVEEVEEDVEEGDGKDNVEESDGNPDSSYYPHIQIMEEEGITRKDLPEDISAMVLTFNRKKVMAERKKAADSTFLKIRNLSAVIADRIMDWIERDIEGEAPKPNVKEEGGGVEEDIIEEGDGEKDGEGESKESGGSIFGGVLGGIFDW